MDNLLVGRDRQPETFHAWGGNEPNDTDGVENGGSHMGSQGTFNWNDTNNTVRGYVVEFPASVTNSVDGEGSTDNAFFTISENKLKTANWL